MFEFREMPPPDERRIVTALFADVVGSTALTESHDAEEARLIIGEAIARAIRIVESYGGTVKDLAGDGLLALFGAPVAHEDDPERALRAGLDIAASIGDYAQEVRRGWGVEGFGVRLGVETGEVVVGEIGAGSRVEYGASGDAVNVAARLQALADPGRVLAGPLAHRLAGDRFTWGDPREVELKGKAEPVAARTVLAPAAAERSARDAAPLTGRDRELALLRDALDGVQHGRGGIVFLSGEPGIGKSRLSAELRQVAADGGVAWLEGRAVSYGAALAWWPVRDLLRGWIGVGTQEPELRVRLAVRRRLEDLLPDRAADLLPYLGAVLGLSLEPDAAALLAPLSPEALQYQTYEVLTDVISALGARGPVVLAIDDLHWADATTLGLFERLLPLTESAPLLLFFNHRPETAHASWQLRERAAREFRHLLTVVELQPLEAGEERRLLAALVEGALAPEVEAKVIAYAEGNPLFLEELARAIGESEAPGEGDIAVPSTLEGVILARLDRLEPGWRELLTAAAVCGRSFSAGLLQAVAEVTEGELRPAVHNLLRLDLLQEERRWPEASYRFKHALIQDAAYRTLVSGRRHELHARAARWLETRYTEGLERVYGLLAHHWLEAEDADQAAHYLRLAGEQALGEWALDEAAAHLRDLVRVLRQSGREAEAARPLFQLASTLHLAMRFREANEAWREAESAWRPEAASETAPTASIVMAVNRVPWEADPFKGYYSVNLRLALQLDDSLFSLRPGPSVEPNLAEAIEVDDSGLSYRIRLRRGLTFNSGRPLDAAAVVAGLRHFLRFSGDATVLWPIKGSQTYSEQGDDSELGISILDDLTVEITLALRDPTFPIHFVTPQMGGVIPGESSGPYRLAELTETLARIELDPDYPRPLHGNVARVEWRSSSTDDAARWMGAGEVDAVVSMGTYAEPPAAGQIEQVGPPVFLLALWPTWKGPPVDEALRRSLAFAVDRGRLEPATGRHQMVAQGGIVPPGLPGHTPGAAPPFDPDQARHWLRESRHRGPLRAAYYTETKFDTVQAVLDGWEEVLGLPVERVAISIRDNLAASKEVHVVQMNWVAHVPDPGYFLNELLLSSSRSNLVGVDDPDLDALLERARSAADGASRMALFHEADRYAVAERALMIPVMYSPIFSILQGWVEGWWEWGNPNQHFSELRVAPRSPRYAGG